MRSVVRMIALGVLAWCLPGLVGASAVAGPPDWRASVRAVAGTSPRGSSAVALAGLPGALGVEPGAGAAAAVADLGQLAGSAYGSDGVHPRSALALARVSAAQVVAAGSLAWLLREGPARQAPRSGTLIRVLQAGVGSTRAVVTDAARLLDRPTASPSSGGSTADVPLANLPQQPTAAQARAAAQAATSQAITESARMLSLARAHAARMDQALGLALPAAAMVHAGAAQYWAFAAITTTGVRPYSVTADQDGDGLPDGPELWVGTDPTRPDTDADGLLDGPEVAQVFAVASPTQADTDGDGVADGSEDPDADGRTIAQEVTGRTNPLNADPDADGLDDGAELTAGTKPGSADTDSDGLLDGTEVGAGLNPLRSDTDGDGTGDAQEQSTQKIVTGQVGVSLTVTGTGQLAGQVSARPAPLSAAEQDFGAVGSGVDLTLTASRVGAARAGAGKAGALAQARLSLTYPESASDPDRLRVFTYNELTRRWQPTGSGLKLDRDRRTVSVTITHFSRYALFDIENWGRKWTALGSECTQGTDPQPADVALVLDSSGSMADNDPQGLRRTAAIEFVDALAASDRASVTDFDDIATVRQTLTGDKSALRAAIAGVDESGGTNLAAGVSAGLGTLPAAATTRVNAVIMLTDGVGSWDQSLIDRAQELRAPIFTIGLGSAVNAVLLQQIATDTGGQYYPITTAADLPKVFRSLAGCVNDPTPGDGLADPNCASPDTDTDGLADCIESGGLALGDGTVVKTNPAAFDTDGDGIGDGQEVGDPSAVTGGVTAFAAVSNPTAADTDADGLADAPELELGTSAWQSDTDTDGLSDSAESGEGTNPSLADTDGDTFTDGYELDHVDDQALDPTVFDERVSKWEYVQQFVQGALCGDLTWSWIGCAASESLVRLAGNILGSLIPFVDVRDAIAGVINADVVAVVFSLVGLVPVIGDAASVVAKIGKYLAKFPANIGKTLIWVTRQDSIALAPAKAIIEKFYPAANLLSRNGFSAEALTLITKTGNLESLTKALAAKNRITDARNIALPVASKAGRIPAHKVAERLIQEQVMPLLEPGWVATKLTTQYRRYKMINGRKVYYREDDIRYGPDLKEAIEVKSGYTTAANRGTDTCEQMRKDRELLDSGVLDSKVWHFVPSESYSRGGKQRISVGPDATVLGCLTKYTMEFVIHAPAL